MSEAYMKLANSFERKKCGYLNNHVCPLKPSKARKGENCDGCSMLEKILYFKQMSMEIEEHDRKIGIQTSISIVNQLAEEYNNDFCEWEYDEFETKWQTDCGVLFALHDSDREITQYCPYCGKKIKVVE